MKHFAATVSLLISSTSATIMPRHATRVLHGLKDQLLRRPALSHGIVGFTLFGASDAFAQKLEVSALHRGKMTDEESSSFDMTRCLSAGAVGAFLAGYVYPFAYKRLDLIWAGKDIVSIAKKSFVEVFTVGIFANSLSMAARGLLTGKNPIDVCSHVMDEMREVTLNDLRVWFPYNCVAFSFIPITVRPATTSLMEAMWQTYISLRSNDYQNQQECAATVEVAMS